MPANQVIIQGEPIYNVQVVDDEANVVVPGEDIVTIAQPIDDIVSVQIAEMGAQGPAGVSVFQTVHTYAIGGDVLMTDYIPPFFFQKLPSQTSILRKVVHQIEAGTSATVNLTRNGSTITGYGGFNVTTTKASTTQDQALSDGDALRPVIIAISGTPQNLTLTLVIEHTVS